MSDAETSLPRRTVVKTAGITSFDASIKKSALTREAKARNKQLRQQLEALAEDGDEDDEEEEPIKESVGKNGKGKGKGKGKEKASSQPGNTTSSNTKSKAKPQKKKAVSQEEENVAELVQDEERRDMLIGVLHTRYHHPLDKLNLLDLDELEKMYSEAKGSKAAPEKAPATKAPAKPKAKAKAPMKTSTKKASAPLPKESPLDWMDSPLKPLFQAQDQSQRAAASPQVKLRKRDLSTSPDRGSKRSRNKLPDQPSKSSKSSEPVAKSANNAKKLTASSGSTEPEDDGEEIDIDLGTKDASKDDTEAEDVKPRRKKGSTDQKGRPKSSTYEGVERKIVDYTLVHAIRIHAQRDMCAGPAEHELYIAEAWKCAVLSCGQDPKNWVMDKDHAACVRQRFNSWRSHSHTRIESGIAGAYNLGSSNLASAVMKRVVEIKDKEFHRHREDGRKGNYEAPYIAESIHLLYYSGRLSAATCCKKEFQATPLPAIAYAAAVIEAFICAYGATGRFVKPKRMGVSDLRVSVRMHLDNLERVVRAAPEGFPSLQEETAKRARVLLGQDAPTLTSNSASGVLSDDDLDEVGPAPRTPNQQQKTRDTLSTTSNPKPAIEQSSDQESDSESDAMDVDDDESHHASTTETGDSNESDSTGGRKRVEKSSPLHDLDEDMVDAATPQNRKSKSESTEEGSSSNLGTDDEGPGVTEQVHGATSGGAIETEEVRDGDSEKGWTGEGEGEGEGRPVDEDVSRPARQVSSAWDNMSDLSEAEGEAEQVNKPVDEPTERGTRSETAGKTMHEPGLMRFAAGPGSVLLFGKQFPIARKLSEEEEAKRMQDTLDELAAQQEAKKVAAAAAAEEAKAAAKAAAKAEKVQKTAKVAKAAETEKVEKAGKVGKSNKEGKPDQGGKASKAGEASKASKPDKAAKNKKGLAKTTVEHKEAAQGQREPEGGTRGAGRQTRSQRRGASST